MAHPYHLHREQQVAHRRVGPILKGEPDGAEKHARSPAFSKVTSKTAAESHDKAPGSKGSNRFARGGKVKHKGQTNIAIVMPHHPAAPAGGPAGPMAGPAGGAPPPMAGPGPLPGAPPGGPPGMPPPGGPPGMPPGMPMRARGGKVAKNIDGEDTKADNKKWAARAEKNSYFRGGAATGVGREEKAEHMKRKGK